MTHASITDRARGALLGLALGDALGMPSQTLDRAEIARRHGRITGLEAPHPGHPVAHGLPAGAVTDDTEQALLLAERLVRDGGRLDARGWVGDLLAWEEGVRRRGLRDLLGPSTKAALDAVAAGASPDESGRAGTTNGAAMRIAPVGIAAPGSDVAALAAQVRSVSRATHDTGEAIAGAAAVAAAISAAIDGAGLDDALDLALRAARAGQALGHAVGEPDMAGRIAAALDLAASGASAEALAARVGTSVASRESVPMAFALLRLAGGDAWEAACLAANAGGDTDTIGAMAGAMGGALGGASALPGDAVAVLRRVNDLPVERLAEGLLALRAAHGAAT